MKPAIGAAGLAAFLALYAPQNAHAQARAKADVICKAGAQKLHYDCIVKLLDARTSQPLSGVTLMVGADMPSMPGMHNVRPVKATEDAEKGTYKAPLVLEMHGDWAVRLDLSGPLRDRVIKVLSFEGERVSEPAPGQPPRRHKH
jgi:hypothetical protein